MGAIIADETLIDMVNRNFQTDYDDDDEDNDDEDVDNENRDENKKEEHMEKEDEELVRDISEEEERVEKYIKTHLSNYKTLDDCSIEEMLMTKFSPSAINLMEKIKTCKRQIHRYHDGRVP